MQKVTIIHSINTKQKQENKNKISELESASIVSSISSIARGKVCGGISTGREVHCVGRGILPHLFIYHHLYKNENFNTF